jgi:rhodanese-related sulfurtransferase
MRFRKPEGSSAMNEKVSTAQRTPTIERLVNLAIIIMAVYFVISLVRMYGPWGQNPQPVEAMKSGKQLVLPDVEWPGPGQTLVLALSTNCHFCSESAPFYQRLLQGLEGKAGVRVVAVLPETVEEGREYIRKLGLSIAEVRQTELSTLGLEGTPTLLLADGAGTVEEVWVGKLMERQEREVFSRLQLANNGAPPEADLVSAEELKRMQSDRQLVVVDVDNRDLFRVNHIPNAVNIPLDELEVRAVNELSPDSKIVVYCHTCPDDAESNIAHDILLKNGFQQVSILKGGLKAWSAETPRPAAQAANPARAGTTP